MKQKELDTAMESLDSIQDICKSMEYNYSSQINKQLNTIRHLLEKEQSRIDPDVVNPNNIRVFVITPQMVLSEELQDTLNSKMSELVALGYKIINCNIISLQPVNAYITYTINDQD